MIYYIWIGPSPNLQEPQGYRPPGQIPSPNFFRDHNEKVISGSRTECTKPAVFKVQTTFHVAIKQIKYCHSLIYVLDRFSLISMTCIHGGKMVLAWLEQVLAAVLICYSSLQSVAPSLSKHKLSTSALTCV